MHQLIGQMAPIERITLRLFNRAILNEPSFSHESLQGKACPGDTLESMMLTTNH